tara:strand:+ start:40 stop:258 length:219 start_codon:yes stop_codon:yes gene_type:complete
MNEVSAAGEHSMMGGNAGTDTPPVAESMNMTMNMADIGEDKGQEEVIMDAIHDVTKVLSSENADELIQLIQG